MELWLDVQSIGYPDRNYAWWYVISMVEAYGNSNLTGQVFMMVEKPVHLRICPKKTL